MDAIRKENEKKKRESQGMPQMGDLAPGSIFEDDSSLSKPSGSFTQPRDPFSMSAALDPKPLSRKRWQRKMVIRDIRGRGRLNKTEKILRTERQDLSKSPWIKTSVKKLFPLARQIAGKPLHEAMVQMRFSRKKAAADVLKHLEFARDQAVAVKGMGLGRVNVQDEGNDDGAAAAAEQGPKPDQDGAREEGRVTLEDKDGKQVVQAEAGEEERSLAITKQLGQANTKLKVDSLLVEDKKGKKRLVTDPTAMYIDEAWVGRGTYGTGSDHRARGQIHRLRLPYTSKSPPPLSSFPSLPFVQVDGMGGADILNLGCRYFSGVERGKDEN